MATLQAPFGRPLCQVSRHADQPRGSGTSQREPSRGAEDHRRRQIFTPQSPTHFSCASMERGIPDAHPLGPTTTERRSPLRCNSSRHRSPSHCQSSPRSYQRQGRGREQGNTKKQWVANFLSSPFFFLPLRDSGSTETAVRMSLRCPQVCATGRLERPLQCVVVMILRLAARRIMLVPHEWTLCYSRGIVVVVACSHTPELMCFLKASMTQKSKIVNFILQRKVSVKFLKIPCRLPSKL